MVAALSAAAVVASPAVAQAGYADCIGGYACTWGDAQYSTNGYGAGLLKFYYNYSNFNGAYYSSTTTSANDSASSVVNAGTSSTVNYYFDANYSQRAFSVRKGERDPDLSSGIYDALTGVTVTGVNDVVSSGCFSGSCA